MLRPGFSTRRIAAELKANGIIHSEDAFILWYYLHHRRSLKAGEYLFDKPRNIIDITIAWLAATSTSIPSSFPKALPCSISRGRLSRRARFGRGLPEGSAIGYCSHR